MSHDERRYLLNFQYKKAMPPRYPCTILETIIKSVLKLCYSLYFVKYADSRGICWCRWHKFHHKSLKFNWDFRILKLYILLRLHKKLIELINTILKARMLASCGLKWWRKPKFPEKTTDFGQPLSCHIPTLVFDPEDTGIRSRAAVMTSEGFTPAAYPGPTVYVI